MSLLSEVNTGKLPYQSYTIQHGIEEVKILIPLKEAKQFEASFHATDDKTKPALLEVVLAHSGKVL